MPAFNFPKPIKLHPVFDMNCQTVVNAEVATVTWNVTVPIDINAYLQGKSIIECIPECLPQLDSTTILDYLDSKEF